MIVGVLRRTASTDDEDMRIVLANPLLQVCIGGFAECAAQVRDLIGMVYQRTTCLPSSAPIAVGIAIPSRYQVAQNGTPISGQCRQ